MTGVQTCALPICFGSRIFSTYYGGSQSEGYGLISIDPNNLYVYLTGLTYSQDVIASSGQGLFIGGTTDHYIVKFTNTGSRVFGKYIGGNSDEYGSLVTCISTNNPNFLQIYVAGETISNGSIATPGTHQTALQSTLNTDGYICTYTINGSACSKIYGT